jgi:hypothetical protein
MKDPNRFYTYAYLREDRTPYYVGKGEKDRIYRKRKGQILPPKDKSRIIFLKQNLLEEEAFKHEIYMIAVFGRKDIGTGILRNKTNGGDGASGAIRSEETKRKLSLSRKNKKWWNDGTGNEKRSVECPGIGWVLGRSDKHKGKMKNRKFWTDENGNMKFSVECPGTGWNIGQSEGTKERNSLRSKNKKWWNDSCGNMKFVVECPGEGWVLGQNEELKRKGSLTRIGRKWWNDSCGNMKFVVECPGEGWVLGKKKKNQN